MQSGHAASAFVCGVLTASCSASNTTPSSPLERGFPTDGGGPIVLVGPAGARLFQPVTLTVSAGTTVQWFWSSAGHNVVSGLEGTPDGMFCSPGDESCGTAPTSAAGATYEHTFALPGTYPYYCSPHVSDGMKGTIVVR